MYIKKEDQAATVRQTVMGGKGEILSRIFLDPKDAAGAGRLFAVNTIAPGCSIGYHSHEGEFEVYYILSGTAKIVDEGEEYLLHAGDMMQCKSGHAHSIENAGEAPLEHIALILYENPAHGTD